MRNRWKNLKPVCVPWKKPDFLKLNNTRSETNGAMILQCLLPKDTNNAMGLFCRLACFMFRLTSCSEPGKASPARISCARQEPWWNQRPWCPLSLCGEGVFSSRKTHNKHRRVSVVALPPTDHQQLTRTQTPHVSRHTCCPAIP